MPFRTTRHNPSAWTTTAPITGACATAWRRAVVSGGAPPYPEPCDYCEVCRWRERCDARRRADDHLSLVANVSKVQIEELKRQGVETMAALAATPLPLGWKPARGAPASL